MGANIYETNSVDNLNDMTYLCNIEYEEDITIPSGSTDDEIREKLLDYGIKEVIDNDNNRYFVRQVNINPNATGGVKYGNQFIQVTKVDNTTYRATSVSGVVGGNVNLQDRFAEYKLQTMGDIADAVATQMGYKLNYNDPNYRQFLTDLSDRFFNHLWGIETLPVIFKAIESGGISNYIDGATYEEIVQYMIDSGVYTNADIDYYEGYDAHNHILEIKNSVADTSSMIGMIISDWVTKTDLGDYHAIPSFGAIRNGFYSTLNGAKAKFYELFGKQPNTFYFAISGNSQLGRIDLDVICYYITHFSIEKNSPLLTAFDITSSRGVSSAITGGWRFGIQFDWETGGAVYSDGERFRTIGNWGTYPVKRSETYPSGESGIFRNYDSTGYYSLTGITNWNSDLELNDTPSIVDRLPTAPIVPSNPTPQDYIKIVNPKQINVDNDDPITNNTYHYYYYETPMSNETQNNVINNNYTTINNYYYYNTTPTESDIGNIVAPPTSVVTGQSNALYTIYNPTQAEIEAFGSWLWSSSIIEILKTVFQNPLDGVLSLQIIYGIPSIGGRKEIKCGYLGSNVDSNYVNNQYITIECGAVNLFEYYGDARDYAPYTEVQLYLPFIGFVPLDVYEVMAGVMSITYIIDVLTGTCIASIKVSRDGVEKVLYSFSGNCAVQLPLSSADKSTLITGAVSGALNGAGMGMHFGGAGMAVGAVAGAVLGGATSGISINRSGNMSGNAGALGIKKPYLLVKRYKTHSAVGYGGLVGVADSTRCYIGDMTGFTQFTGIKLNVNATESELKEIESLLTEGVFV